MAGRKLGVLTVVDTLLTAGAETVATRIALALDRDRFDSVICSTRPSAPEVVETVRAAGIEVLELERASRVEVWRWVPLVRLLRSGRIDIVHAHKFGSNLWLSMLSPLADVPVFLAHEHSWSYEGRPFRRHVDRVLIARAATRVVAVSPADRERMIELERIPADKVALIPNGIPDTAVGDGERVRRKLDLPPRAAVVGTVCSLRPEKGLDIALRAIAELVKRRPELRFLVVGDGPERRPLEQLAGELGVPAIFVGQRPNEEVPDWLALMDVVVCTSHFEGMPLAVLEWMAAGKAIAASRVGGIPWILEDGDEALLVPPHDHAALAGAIARLLDDPGERDRLGAAAQRRQFRDFRFEATVARTEELYADLYAAAVA
ncbi:MAG TPA: glycosyltransferase family 4 protein [Gaiellaceae bacterium]|nr:glycosyltransferase family 4 protein [Gaiellaceae bacterium]